MSQVQSMSFSEGLPATLPLYLAQESTCVMAFDHLSALQGCYGSQHQHQHQHQHKAVAVAWLASRWFTAYDFDGMTGTPG